MNNGKVLCMSYPPSIDQQFDKALLQTDFKLGDNAKGFLKVYDDICRLCESKNMSMQKKSTFKRLKKEFLQLYEKATEKENSKEQTPNKTKGPFYFVRITERRHERVYRGFRYGIDSVVTKYRRHNGS